MTAEKAAAEAEEARKREEEAEEQRKLASKELAGESIRRELVESALFPLYFSFFSFPADYYFFFLRMNRGSSRDCPRSRRYRRSRRRSRIRSLACP